MGSLMRRAVACVCRGQDDMGAPTETYPHNPTGAPQVSAARIVP
jgi:hypothetical protein